MTAKSRYWDHERCAWVTYETTAVPETLAAEALPEQREDEPSPASANVTAD